MGEKAARVNHQPPRQSRLAVGLTFGYCPKKILQYLSPPQVWSANAVVRLITYRVVSQTPPLDHRLLLYPIPWLLCKVRCMAVHVISVQAGGTFARATSLQLKPVASGAPVAPFGERDTLLPRPLFVSPSTAQASRSIISAQLRGRRQYGLSSNTEPGDFL